jgi:hypothetical protein
MRYRNFAPTGFDTEGLGLPNRQDWIVAPVSITRDSGSLDQSNFYTALEILGGESETVEVHRFGHWGPGWFEIILVHPDRESEIDEIEGSLENYPVLDDEDYSRREYDECCEYWDQMGYSERIDICAREGASIFACRHETPPSEVLFRLRDWVNEG